MLSAVVLTKNEENSLAGCLRSLRFCDEIVVIDDFSQDQTREIAKKFGARVFRRQLKNDFSAQRNFGLQKAKGDWVLFVDADEEVPPALQKEILQAIKAANFNGFYLKRQDYFLGKPLRFGETARVRLLRLAKKNCGRWQMPVHEVWQIKGRLGQLKNPLLHRRKLTIAQFMEKINRYSSIRARQLYRQGVKTNWLLILAYPIAKFVYNYFGRLGFLDGQVGFVMAAMMSVHSFLVRAKLYLLWLNQGEEEFKIPPLKELYKRYG